MSLAKHSVSVIICAYSDERLEQLHQAIASVRGQHLEPCETLVVIDHNPGLLARVSAAHPDIKVIANAGGRGLSGARNTGMGLARGDIVAFLDDDAVAEPDWLQRMVLHYDDPRVMGLGGRVIPIWQAGRPRWLPEEFHWVVGCSYRGQPERTGPVRNPIGCNMSIRRVLLDDLGGFREGIGRAGADAAGCEETEFFIRARQALPGSLILYDPQMSVRHHVPAERGRWRYFLRRCWAEGRSKTLVVRQAGARDGLSSEQRYVARVLPAGIIRGLADACTLRDPWGLARVGGIFVGLGFTAAGYVGASLAGTWRRA